MTTLQTALTVATTVTASGTLAAGKHTPVDATGGALTMTLPTPATVGARLRVEKIDSSANAVTVSGTIRGSASTISLAWQFESVELFAESLTSWRVAAGHKTKAGLDAAYAAPGDLPSTPGKNLLPANFRKWAKALAAVRTGAGSAKLLAVGDSTTLGLHAASPPVQLVAWPAVLRTLLNSASLPAVHGLFIPQTTPIDSRWVYGTGWSNQSAGAGWGSGPNDANGTAGGSGTCTYTPGVGSVDTFDVYYLKASFSGTFSVNIDGGTDTVVATNSATAAIGKVTLTATAGSSHAVNFHAVTGQAVWIVGVDAYLSTTPAVRVANAGSSGSTTTGWVAANSVNCIKAYAPDLTVIMLGINDGNTSVSTATWQANITTLVQAAQVSGDVVIASTVPSSGDPNLTAEQGYRAATPALAASLGCGYVDIFGRFGSYTSANGLGFMFDTVHPLASGQADMGTAFHQAVRAIS